MIKEILNKCGVKLSVKPKMVVKDNVCKNQSYSGTVPDIALPEATKTMLLLLVQGQKGISLILPRKTIQTINIGSDFELRLNFDLTEQMKEFNLTLPVTLILDVTDDPTETMAGMTVSIGYYLARFTVSGMVSSWKPFNLIGKNPDFNVLLNKPHRNPITEFSGNDVEEHEYSSDHTLIRNWDFPKDSFIGRILVTIWDDKVVTNSLFLNELNSHFKDNQQILTREYATIEAAIIDKEEKEWHIV